MNSAGALELVNSAYTLTLVYFGDNGIFSIPNTAATTSGVPTSNALELNAGHSYLFDDGNPHFISTSGNIWLDSLDSGQVRIGTSPQSGSGSQLVVGGGGITTSGPITSSNSTGNSFTFRVSTFTTGDAQTLAMDNINFRVSAGIANVSAVSGSFTLAGETMQMIFGSAIGHTSFDSRTVSAGTWYSLGTSDTFNAHPGATLVFSGVDTSNNRLYRTTFVNTGNNTAAITIERLA
jgi:hypothetical protein